MASVNPAITITTEYLGTKKKVGCKCSVCGYEWSASPGNLTGSGGRVPTGCPRCHKQERYTPERFRELASKKSPQLEILEDYKGSQSKILCRCKKCGYESYVVATDLIRTKGHGCNRCNRLIHKTTESFMEEMKNSGVNITPLEEYINAQTPILFRCDDCGKEWYVRPSDLSHGARCPHCKHNNKFAAKRAELVEYMDRFDPTIEVLGEYKGRHNHIKCRCRICGNEWNSTPGNLMGGCGCPACKSSAGERRIRAYLMGHGVMYVQEYRFKDCRDEHVLPFDFYIPHMNMVVEYDGEQHYRPVKFAGTNDNGGTVRYLKTLRRDAIKNKYCADHDIKLVRIPYTEYDEIDEILNELLA